MFVKAKSKIIQKRQILGLIDVPGSSSITNEKVVSESPELGIRAIAGETIGIGLPIYLQNGYAYLCNGVHKCEYFSAMSADTNESIILYKDGVISTSETLNANRLLIYLNRNGISQYPEKEIGYYWQIVGKYENGSIRIDIREGFKIV